MDELEMRKVLLTHAKLIIDTVLSVYDVLWDIISTDIDYDNLEIKITKQTESSTVIYTLILDNITDKFYLGRKDFIKTIDSFSELLNYCIIKAGETLDEYNNNLIRKYNSNKIILACHKEFDIAKITLFAELLDSFKELTNMFFEDENTLIIVPGYFDKFYPKKTVYINFKNVNEGEAQTRLIYSVDSNTSFSKTELHEYVYTKIIEAINNE